MAEPDQNAQATPEAAQEQPVAEQPVAEQQVAPARSGQPKGGQQKGGQKGGQQQKGGRPAQANITLPSGSGRSTRTPVEALAPIANNRKVALAREVGRLVAQRAKEKGVSRVVFDRGGYAYHGRVASLAEGAREGGLDF